MSKGIVNRTIAKAFAEGRPAKGNNTVCTGDTVVLHGSKIAWRDEHGQVWLCLCGYDTATTRARLSAIARAIDPRCNGVSTASGRITLRFADDRVEPIDSCNPFTLHGPLASMALRAEREMAREMARA